MKQAIIHYIDLPERILRKLATKITKLPIEVIGAILWINAKLGDMTWL